MATGPVFPLSTAEAGTWKAIGDAADELAKLGQDKAFLAALTPATKKFYDTGVPAAIKAQVPGGNIKATIAQAYDLLKNTQEDITSAISNAPGSGAPANLFAYMKTVIAAFTTLQGEAPKFRLQESEKALAEVCSQLAATLETEIGNVFTPNEKTAVVKKNLSVARQHLTGIADALGGTRLMADAYNVHGACLEIGQLAQQVMNAMPGGASKNAVQAQFQQVLVANAAYLAVRQEVAQQPYQTYMKLQQVAGTFAQRAVRKYESCQEAVAAIESTSATGQQVYDGLCVWIYQFLRPQTPTQAIRNSVNVGFVSGTTPDPLVPAILPSGLEADHIISMKIMTQNPNWQYLTMGDKLGILNTANNFVGIGKSTNTSKGEKTYSEWMAWLNLDTNGVVQAKSALNGMTFDVPMLQSYIAREALLKPQIDAAIDAAMQARKQALQNQYGNM